MKTLKKNIFKPEFMLLLGLFILNIVIIITILLKPNQITHDKLISHNSKIIRTINHSNK